MNNPTPEKNNYIIANVNGIGWKSCKSSPLGGTTYNILAFYNNEIFMIDATNSCNSTNNYPMEIYLEINNLVDTGLYQLGGLSNNIGGVNGTKTDLNGNLLIHTTDSLHTGILKITKLDTATSRISGTFEFNAYNADSNVTLNVSGGVFYNIYYY